MFIGQIKRWLYAPKSRFKVRDVVQQKGADNLLMYVIEICSEPSMKEPLIHCQWSDPKIGIRKNLFRESMLELFDWDKAYRSIPPQQNQPTN